MYHNLMISTTKVVKSELMQPILYIGNLSNNIEMQKRRKPNLRKKLFLDKCAMY